MQIIVYGRIRDVPRRVGYGPQNFLLQSLDDLCMGRLRTAPELNTVRPYRLEHAFVQEKALIFVPKSNTCLAILDLSGDASF